VEVIAKMTISLSQDRIAETHLNPQGRKGFGASPDARLTTRAPSQSSEKQRIGRDVSLRLHHISASTSMSTPVLYPVYCIVCLSQAESKAVLSLRLLRLPQIMVLSLVRRWLKLSWPAVGAAALTRVSKFSSKFPSVARRPHRWPPDHHLHIPSLAPALQAAPTHNQHRL
jgi:hypothetical protein